MNESLLTSEAATPQQGEATSQPAAEAPATVDEGQAAQEQQPAEGQTDASTEVKEPEGDKKPEGAPESYDFKAPDGASFDSAVVASFSEVAKELNLSQDAAQKILDKVAPVMQTRQAEALEAARNEWASSARADKEFGGDKLAENLGVAKKALDTFGSPELRTLLNETGLGNHPELIRLMYRAGKAISEDRFVGSQQGGAAPRDPAKVLFPNMN